MKLITMIKPRLLQEIVRRKKIKIAIPIIILKRIKKKARKINPTLMKIVAIKEVVKIITITAIIKMTIKLIGIMI